MFKIRPALMHEIPALNDLIILSSNGLSVGYYSPEEITGLNQYVFGVDSELVQDQTYFVIEKDNLFVACGGWSKRATLFGGDNYSNRQSGLLNPETDAAKIRAFFIHPDFARQGLGTMLMQHCEQSALEAGFKQLELMSTLPGIDFYARQGFVGTDIVEIALPNGLAIKLKPMRKQLLVVVREVLL